MANDDREGNIAKYRAGFNGGPYFKDPIKEPRRPFVKVVTEANSTVRKEKDIPRGSVIDSWFYRRK